MVSEPRGLARGEEAVGQEKVLSWGGDTRGGVWGRVVPGPWEMGGGRGGPYLGGLTLDPLFLLCPSISPSAQGCCRPTISISFLGGESSSGLQGSV